MIIVIGRNSFISREFVASLEQTSNISLAHSEIEKIKNIPNVECIINFAFAPQLYTAAYAPELDIDKKIGTYAANLGIHYVMMSTRKVYNSTDQWNAHEDNPVNGQDVYGRNKILIENELGQMLGPKLTILRPGNVFGFERQPGRPRFGAYMLNQLAEKDEIRLTVSPSVRRDIVPVDYFCEVLRQVIAKKLSGIINVGAGQAVEVGKIASSILEGFGRGRLINTSTEVVDEFQLDSGRLASELGLTCGVERIMQFSKSLGAKLKKEIEINVPRT